MALCTGASDHNLVVEDIPSLIPITSPSKLCSPAPMALKPYVDC